jgi:hypothetical protein
MTLATSTPRYESLPIVSDEGFPQSFRLSLGARIYRMTFYVNVTESLLDATLEDAVLELPQEEAFMVLRVARESDAAEPETILQRKLVTGLDYAAAELAFRFTELRVARRNINGAGSHGSSVEGGVALRWASSSGTG